MSHDPHPAGSPQAPPQNADSWQLFQTLIDQLAEGVSISTFDGRVEHANRALVAMAGYASFDEFPRIPALSTYDKPEDAARLRELLTRDGVVRGFQTVGVRKDGSRFPARLTSVVLPDAPGAPRRFLSIVEDRTESERAHEQMELTQRSIDVAPACAYWFDPDGRFLYANEAACRALGYTLDELLQLRVGDVNPRATPERWAEVWQLLKTKGTFAAETVHRRKDGSTFPVQLSSSYFEIGGREYCNGYAYDLTQQKRAEEERRALQAQLAQARKMESIGRLAGGIAHDFNNMLGVIVGNVELALQPDASSDEVRTLLREIRAVAARSAELTRQLLGFARRQDITPRVLDLNGAIDERLSMLRRLIGEHITLAWHPGARVPPVRFDPAQLTQVLTNLCINARQAISRVGTIAIETAPVTLGTATAAAGRVPGDYVRLTVNDTGEGMPASVQAHLFEPFFTTRADGEGTGLGLATVYGIITQNNGYIDVESQEGVGSTFTIFLPSHKGPHEGQEEQPPAEASAVPETTVLVVEDEPALLRITTRLLRAAGYQVLQATDGESALHLLRGHVGAVDLLLTDVVMPKMNGVDLAARVRVLRPGIAQLFMSGYTAGAFSSPIDEHGGHFIAKPFTGGELAAKVREVLGKRG